MVKSADSESSMDPIKYFVLKVLSLKYLYILCVVCFLALAVLYNKYTTQTYESSSSISPIKDKTSSLLSSNQFFSGVSSMESLTNIENQLTNLKSYALVYKTITEMNFEVSYFRENSKYLKQTIELYEFTPFKITIDKSHIQAIETKFFITVLDESSFRLTASQEDVSSYNYLDNIITSINNDVEIDTICKFNETINNKLFKFAVALNKDFILNKKGPSYQYYFKLRHLDFLAKEYLGNLKVEKVTPLASILKITFRAENLDKTISFLNRYLNTFLEDNLAKKNKIALSTVNFIDSQISEVSDSLELSESTLKNYRAANQVMDLSFQGQRIIEQRTQIETERATLQVQERYHNYVINYFKANQDRIGSGVVPPSSMNVLDPITNQLITEFINLNTQRSNITSGTTSNEKNIFLGQIDKKIMAQKQAIIENSTNNLNTITLSLNELNYREEKLSNEISRLPKTEMNMVSMQRKFNLNDVIYTYLLQKRSEAAISLASNYPDFEILEPARTITSLVTSPKYSINIVLALFLGLFFPTAYLIIRDIFNFKIRSTDDIEYLTNRSVLSIIYSNKNKSELVVAENPKSAISESFRNLRSSLFLKSTEFKSKVILLSSSQPGDGKSFVSLNLACSLASVGYKTILIDSDLRKPRLHAKLKEENNIGLSSYMTQKGPIEKYIIKTHIENLSFIAAGPVLPNPSELIESGILDEMMNNLKTNYDYIIIDTPPMGIVSDATLLMKYASKILIVIRYNYTRKDILVDVANKLKENKFTDYNLVFNDLNIQKSSYKHYSNYYIKE